MDTIHKQAPKRTLILSFLLSSILFTLLLGYIDEGHYSFKGLWEKEDLPALVIYSLLFLGTQLFIAQVVLRYYEGRYKILFSILLLLAFLFVLILLGFLNHYIVAKIS